jgi:ATP-dependent DNA helicase RecG
MASSLQTLIKILHLEQKKGYQNKAVIGGFARFAYHWAREAHSQAQTDAHHALVDQIADRLREYETLPEQQRPEWIEQIIVLATMQPTSAEEREPASQSVSPAASAEAATVMPPTVQEALPALEEAQGEAESPEAEIPLEEAVGLEEEFVILAPSEEAAEPVSAPLSVRERRGYAWRQFTPASEEELRGLDTPVSSVSGIGQKRAEQLERLGVRTIRELLYLFPRRYNDFTRMKIISQLRPDEEVTVMGILERIRTQQMKRGGTLVEAYLTDESGSLRLSWFNQPWMEHQLKEGEPVIVSGKVDQYLGRLVMNAPEMEPLEREWLHAGRVVPVYPLTKDLSARVMRRLMKEVVDAWAPRLPDYLPLEVRESADLMDYGDAIAQAHFPDSWEDKEAALQRLAFDELFILHLAMLRQRYAWQARQSTPISVDDEWLSAFEASLPYQLTTAQRRAIADIRRDMASDIPMNRLLQGDVGSGKTVVAAIAIGMAVANGTQAAIMVPTSILAEQHYVTLKRILHHSPLGDQLNIALLTGSISDLERESIYTGLADGSIQVVVGTHALIQAGVAFAHLGLAIIDEQHRFGVTQRGALRDKAAGGNPHLLVMTATPIPRTLALTIHADLDLTIIDEMPPGRIPVQTRVLQPKERERGYAFVRSQIEKGHQAYIICPLIEESEKLQARSATAEYERLQKTVFSDLRLGLLHGRMRPDEKEAVMASFYRRELDILVSTSVIEVGIDVPNATVIMIEGANRFGLAQLHQLRGRVGRAEHPGYCLLLSDQPFFDYDERLRAVEETNDGFRLAQIDWEMRGAGDILGTRQSGFGVIHFADLMDTHLVELVQREARAVYERDPLLTLPEHEALRQLVDRISDTGADIS